ncbi:hypothetical protein RQP46_009244 [Phenoliferia psychrophenolica]
MSYVAGNWSWRTPYILQVVPAAYMLVAIQFVPETPRWLMSKGREAEAMAFLVKYHGNGAKDDELEFKQDTWGQLFATKGNRHRIQIVLLIVIMQNLSGTAIAGGYYTTILNLVGITGASKLTGINAALTATVLICSIVGACIVNKVPRRKMLPGGPLFFSYQTECLSYSVRAKGMMIWGLANKTISIFNAYVNSIALANIGYKYYIVYCVFLFCQLVAMHFVLIAVLFDGDNTAQVPVTPYEQAMHHLEKEKPLE